MSLKDSILAAADAPLQKVEAPEWGTDLFVRTMSGTERDTWELAAFKDGKMVPEYFRAKLLVRVLCEADGTRVFNDDDAAALSGKSSAVLIRLYDVAAKVNGLTKQDVDDLTKN